MVWLVQAQAGTKSWQMGRPGCVIYRIEGITCASLWWHNLHWLLDEGRPTALKAKDSQRNASLVEQATLLSQHHAHTPMHVADSFAYDGRLGQHGYGRSYEYIVANQALMKL